MRIDFSDAVISDRLQALPRALDSGSAGGQLRLYTDPVPARGATPTGATELVRFTFPKPSLADVTAGVLTLHAPASTLGRATGIPTWGRFLNSGGTFVADADAGGTSSSAAIKVESDLSTVRIYLGGSVTAAVVSLQEA